MNRRAVLPSTKLWAVAIAALVLPAGSTLPAETAPEDSWENYRVLVERNIFLRDRRPARPRGPSLGPREPIVRDSDRDVVLTGIGRRNGEYVAFFENTATGVTTRARMGEDVGKGRIRAITLDTVEYERDGVVTRIEIGYALQGGRFVRETVPTSSRATTRPSDSSLSTTAPATAPAEQASEASPAGSGGGAESTDVEDILRQMRQRREQELRK